MEHGFVAWFLDRFRENIRVVREAPEAFIIMAIVVASIVYFIVNGLHPERFAQLNDRVAFLDDKLKDYQERLHGATPEDAQKKIDDLSRKVEDQQKQIEALIHPPRNPNMLYQGDSEVGAVRDPYIDVAGGIIMFPVITSKFELDMRKIFWFREWPLRCTGQLANIMTFGAVQQINYPNMICQIQTSP